MLTEWRTRLRKGMLGLFSCPWFIEHHCLLSASEAILVQIKVWPLRAVSTATYSVKDTVCFPFTYFESCWTYMHWEHTRILCSQGITYQWGGKEWQWTYFTYFLYYCVCSILLWDFIYKTQVQRYNYEEFQDGDRRTLN